MARRGAAKALILSGTFSPEGRSACLTVSRIDRKKDEYRSYHYLRRNGKLRKLTSFGRESRFLYLDEDTILFPSRRDRPEEGNPSSVWYRISLSGGEAEEAYRFPIGVSKILPLPGGDLIVLGSAEPGHQPLSDIAFASLINWCTRQESNLRPSESESDALSN